jgi:hypothetical protein
MPPSKFASGTGLQIPLKTASLGLRSESDCGFDSPWRVPRCVWAFPTIVFDEARVEVVCYTGVMQAVVCFTNEYVNVMKRFH